MSHDLKVSCGFGLTSFGNCLLVAPIGNLLSPRLFMAVCYIRKSGELELASFLWLKSFKKLMPVDICRHKKRTLSQAGMRYKPNWIEYMIRIAIAF